MATSQAQNPITQALCGAAVTRNHFHIFQEEWIGLTRLGLTPPSREAVIHRACARGITEADVRDWERAPNGTVTVRMWNHRRVIIGNPAVVLASVGVA